MPETSGINVGVHAQRGHEPVRGNWACDTCGDPWPCEPAKKHLRATMTSPALGMMMGAHWMAASVDMPHKLAGVLYERFFGWIRDKA